MEKKTKNNYNEIYLYHGSDCAVEKPDFSYAKKGKDFGLGFYLSFDREQALNFAKIIKRRNNSKKCYINIYKVINFDNLKIKHFNETNDEWLDCILGYRNGKYSYLSKPFDDYDIIIGKIADDQTAITINAYIQGAYGDPETKGAKKRAIENLLTNRLNKQICLKSYASLEMIEYVNAEEIK